VSSPSTTIRPRPDNLAHLANHLAVKLIEHDIVEPLDCRVDEIYNLACPASPPLNQKDAISTVRTCVIGTENLLALAVRNRARFFQASTSEVYGGPEAHPQSEEYRGKLNLIGIRACYDEGKRVAETLCFDYHRQHRVDIKVARIFNIYGPRMNPRDGWVVSNFVVQALRGEDLTIYGNGDQTRSFCYCDDLIEGFLRLMDSLMEVMGPVNLGNPHELRVRDLVELVVTMTRTKSRIVNRPLPSRRSLAALSGHLPGRPASGLVSQGAAARRAPQHHCAL
jgi:UDP-glucuronate decarboxylase